MALRFNAHQTTGNFNGVNAGSSVAGSTIFMGGSVFQKVGSLSAIVVVDIETSTLTASASWEVSNDNSTWMDVAHASNNPAAVVLATGTAGADPTITKVIPAPDAVYGYKFARIKVTMGVTNGTTNDTYTFGYSYRQLTGSEAR